MIIPSHSRSRGKAVKIEDVAEKAGVSIMSVSRAMRDVEGISVKKREQIIKIARELGYYPNRVAVSLAASSSNLIGVSVPTLFGTVFTEIYIGMRKSFDKAGFSTIFDVTEYSKDREEAWVERLIAWRPAGIILSGIDHNESTVTKLTKARIPLLEIWDYTPNPLDLCVGVDHFDAGKKMGQYLVGLGYQTPGYVGVTAGLDTRADRRLEGLQYSFLEKSCPFHSIHRSNQAASFESGFQTTKKMVEASGRRPDVICYLNDNMAFGGLMYLERAGIDCPNEIGIVGYNGLNINSVSPKRITTSITPRVAMGEIAAQLLIAKILGANTETAMALKVTIEQGQTTKSQIA
jgi:LacI family gluconate utilization system Gnt-I transcriptional repressor